MRCLFCMISPPLVGEKRSAGTRSHRMKFCVQGGLGALPSTSKQNGNPGRDFPLWGRCVLTPALLAKFIAYDKLVITSMIKMVYYHPQSWNVCMRGPACSNSSILHLFRQMVRLSVPMVFHERFPNRTGL